MMNAATFDRSFRVAINDFLSSFFDGQTHDFAAVAGVTAASGQTLEFPDCEILFDRQQFGVEMGRPKIVAVPVNRPRQRRKATPTGSRLDFRLQTQFLIYTADPDKSWEMNRKICDLLGWVFLGDAAGCAAKGLKVIDVGNVLALAGDASQELQISQIMITFQVALNFSNPL